MKKTYYEKVGRRYVPVREYDSEVLDSMPAGAHVIVCEPSRTLYKYQIDPALAPMIAAGLIAHDAITDAITTESGKISVRDHSLPLTDDERAAWEHLIKVFGDSARFLQRPSVHDCVAVGLGIMQQQAERLMRYPAVQEAYEQFLLVCKLTQDQNSVDP